MNANISRFNGEFLDKYEESLPSFTVHLYHEHWYLNKAKLLYTNQCSSILEDIRAFRIPVDFLEILDDAQVPFYEGRLIVELLDYRSPNRSKSHVENPERTRVLLHPNDETIWADILLLNAKNGNKWTDRELLELEASIVHQTAPPLCLDPDLNLTRIVNTIIRATSPGIPHSLKRKQSADVEEDESERIKRTKMMQFMDPKVGKPNPPRLLSRIERYFGDAKRDFVPPTKIASPPVNGQEQVQQSQPTPPIQQAQQAQTQQTAQLQQPQPQPQPQPPLQPPPQPTQPQPQPQTVSQPNHVLQSQAPINRIQIPPPPPGHHQDMLRNRSTPAPTPESDTGASQIANNGRNPPRPGSVNPRESAERSPATSIMPTPQRPLSNLPPEEPKPITQTVPQRPASTVPGAQTNNPTSFQATLPPPQFLQQPPPGPRKKAPAMTLPNQVPHSSPHLQMTAQQAQAVLKGQGFMKLAASNPQQAKELLRRFSGIPNNAALAQNVPVRSSPLASGSGVRNGALPVNQQAPTQPQVQSTQAQGIARNSPHLMQQQIVQQRGSPLLSAAPTHRPSPSRSPMPGTPQPMPSQQSPPQAQLQAQGHLQQMQQMQQLQQYQQMQQMQQMQANMGQQVSGPNYAAMAAQFFPRQGMQGQPNQQNINRVGTPQHPQAAVQQMQMQRAPMPQQQQQNPPHPQPNQTQQALQQQHSASIMSNLPYHPTNSNYAQLQQMAGYNPAWRAALQAGHGMPLTPQQQQQLMMAQMMGRGMGQKPPQPRQ